MEGEDSEKKAESGKTPSEGTLSAPGKQSSLPVELASDDLPKPASNTSRSRSVASSPDAKSGSVSFKGPKGSSSDRKNSVQSAALPASGSIGTRAPSKRLTESDEVGKEIQNNASGIRTADNTGEVVHRNNLPGFGAFPCTDSLLEKRNPFIHNPPQPEERRARIQYPRSPKDYIINLREDLADFQESHGLPRTRDYSFVSLGLALAQETGRAIYSIFLMFAELFPILAIISLIVRFALDKLIEILETTETVPKIKKSVIFALEMLAIIIPLWILIGTIIIPLITLLFSIFKRMLRIKGGGGGGKKRVIRPKPKGKTCNLK